MGPRSRICTLTGRALAAAAQAMGCPFRPAKDPRLRQLPLSDPLTVSWGTHPIHPTSPHPDAPRKPLHPPSRSPNQLCPIGFNAATLATLERERHVDMN
jgi:hypothetical protein